MPDPLRDKLRACPDQEAVLDCALGEALRLTGTALGNIQLHQRASGFLTIEAQRGFKEPFLNFFRHVSADDDSACGRALRARRQVVIEDVCADEEYQPYRQVALEAGYRSVQSTPLVAPRGTVLGVLSTHDPRPHRMSKTALRAVALLARTLAAEIAGRLRPPRSSRLLTPREREVLTCAALGKSAAAIGTILGITKRTVDEHVRSATHKIGAHNRTHAVALAVRDGLIDPWRRKE